MITIIAEIQGRKASGNYMSQQFIHQNKLPIKTTKECGIDGEPITEGYKRRTDKLLLKVETRQGFFSLR